MHVQRVEHADKRCPSAMVPGRFLARSRRRLGRFKPVHGAEDLLVIAGSLRCYLFHSRVCARQRLPLLDNSTTPPYRLLQTNSGRDEDHVSEAKSDTRRG
jgi:hypothetical protein